MSPSAYPSRVPHRASPTQILNHRDWNAAYVSVMGVTERGKRLPVAGSTAEYLEFQLANLLENPLGDPDHLEDVRRLATGMVRKSAAFQARREERPSAQ